MKNTIKKLIKKTALLQLFLLTILLNSFMGSPSIAHQIGNLEKSSLAELVESSSPSVVTIAIKGKVKMQQNPFFNDPFFERFFGQPQPPREREFGGGGSGVVVDGTKGYQIIRWSGCI